MDGGIPDFRDPTKSSPMPIAEPGSRVGQIQKEVGAIADAMGLVGPERDKFMREQSQAQTVKEAKAGIGARTLIKSLQREGMTNEEIKKAIGGTEGKTKSQVQSELQRVQRDRASQRRIQSEDTRISEQSNVIAGMEERDDQGVAMNDAARFVDMERTLSGSGADPDGEPLMNSLTASQKREFNRLRDKVASDRARGNDFSRLEKFVTDAELKANRKYLKAQEQERKSTLAAAQKKAQTDEEKAWVGNMIKEADALKDTEKEYLEADKKTREEMMTPEQFRELQNRRGQIMGQIGQFNQGKVQAPQGEAPQDNRQSVIDAFMKANPNMTSEQAEAEAKARGYIK
jgi:hypothetical protein